MCIPGLDPVTLSILAASTAASVGGKMLNDREDAASMRAQANARNNVLQQYLARQDQFANENQAYLKKTTDAYQSDKQAESLQQNADTRNATIDKTATTPDVNDIPTTGSAPNVVKSEIGKRIADAFRSATDQSKAKAKVSAYGDTMLGNAINIGDTGRRIDTTNSFARAEAANLPAAQEYAGETAFKPRSGIGDIISGLGQLGSSAAGYGLFGAKPGVVNTSRIGFATPSQRA